MRSAPSDPPGPAGHDAWPYQDGRPRYQPRPRDQLPDPVAITAHDAALAAEHQLLRDTR
jgi:hypothetical protein